MYKTIYNLKDQIFDHTDIEEILNLVLQLTDSDKKLQDVKIYVPSQSSIDSILFGIDGLIHDNRSFEYKGLKGGIYTPRTYQTGNIVQSEIVIAVCVDNDLLYKIEDSNSIAYMLVVPEMPGMCDKWLTIHSALNLQTKKEIPNTLLCPKLVDRCIGWLKGESVKMSPLYHITMESYIKMATNILVMNGLHTDCDTILKQCLLRGVSHRDAYAVAKIMSATTTYKLSTKPDYGYLMEWIDKEEWERN